jgi:hypothetical protein
MAAGQRAVLAVVAGLAGETLDDPHAFDRLRQRAGQPALALRHRSGKPREPGMEVSVRHPNERSKTKQEEEQGRIVGEHQHHRAEHLADEEEAEEEYILDSTAQGLDVGDDPAENASQFGACEVPHGHALQPHKNLVAQVVDNRLPELKGEALPEVKRELGGQREREKTQSPKPESRHVSAGDRAADHRRQRPGERGLLRGSHERQHQNDVPLSRIGARLLENAPKHRPIHRRSRGAFSSSQGAVTLIDAGRTQQAHRSTSSARPASVSNRRRLSGSTI